MTIERETLELDVLFVGAGPASLAGAYRLATRIAAHNASLEPGREPIEVTIGVLEKGKEAGAHALSGAVVDPSALRELFPDDWQSAPFEAPVGEEAVWWLSEKHAVPFPVIPPPLRNHGNYVASLGRLVKWMAPKVEAAGVDVFYEFAAARALLEDGKVVGVRTGDRGVSHDGSKKANYEPGIDIRTQVTVLGEGVRGTLVKQLDRELGLWEGANPQTYAVGVKEIWELPPGRVAPGQVIHTLGWPLDAHTFGGSFLYGMRDDQLIVGLVVGLDYRDPWLDPHRELQRLKTHPRIRALLDGGKMTFYGAKALPEGGWFSRPRGAGDGFLVIGDSAGYLNSQRLKGIHLAMRSGMCAADTIFEALCAGGITAERLARMEDKVAAGPIREEMWKVRNFHQGFDRGALGGMVQAGLGIVTGGRGWGLFDRLRSEPGHQRMLTRLAASGHGIEPPAPPVYDGELTFDKLADVYHSATAHEEDQPVHLVVTDPDVCVDRCTAEYGNPCQRFCPAHVYEMVEDAAAPAGRRLQINFSNCVHCKTCDVMDPYQVIDWVPPEGGGGPNYSRM